VQAPNRARPDPEFVGCTARVREKLVRMITGITARVLAAQNPGTIQVPGVAERLTGELSR
jgi:hypothetical protein